MNLFCRPRPLPGKGSPAAGTLTVTISPAGAVTAGAQWSVDGGATWNDSGDTLTLAPAAYTVSFKAVAGWDTPADIPVTIVAGGAVTEAGTYIEALMWWLASAGDLEATAGAATITGSWNGAGAVSFADDRLEVPGTEDATWATPASVQTALAGTGTLTTTVLFEDNVGVIPDGVIFDLQFSDFTPFEMDTGNLKAEKGALSATVAFAPTKGVDYDLRVEWTAVTLRVGYKPSSESNYTWSV